jgi:hypothetical protein
LNVVVISISACVVINHFKNRLQHWIWSNDAHRKLNEILLNHSLRFSMHDYWLEVLRLYVYVFRFHMQGQEILMRYQSIKKCVSHKHVSIKMNWKPEKEFLLVKGIKIRPDPLPYRNDKRRDFCSRYDGYGDFCSGKFIY